MSSVDWWGSRSIAGSIWRCAKEGMASVATPIWVQELTIGASYLQVNASVDPHSIELLHEALQAPKSISWYAAGAA